MTNAFTAKPDLSKWTKKLRHAHLSSVGSTMYRPQNNDIRLPGTNLNRRPKEMKKGKK